MEAIDTDPISPTITLHYGGFEHWCDQKLEVCVSHRESYVYLEIGCVRLFISAEQYEKFRSDVASLPEYRIAGGGPFRPVHTSTEADIEPPIAIPDHDQERDARLQLPSQEVRNG